MITSNDNDDLTPADGLYAARTAIAEVNPSPWRPGIGELAQVLLDPHRNLTHAEQRALFTDARLRADFKHLRARAGALEIPALAAASEGNIATRAFEGGTARIHSSRKQGQIYVIIELQEQAAEPGSMVLESPAGEVVKRMLPPTDERGRSVIVLDETEPADGLFLRLIRDPTVSGSVLIR
jgi:hypothetical protein